MTGTGFPGESGFQVEVPGGQGVQIGDGNRQVNFFVENLIVQNQGSQLLVAAAARDPGAIFRDTDIDAFVGRAWLRREIDHFFATHPAGYVLIEAEAGLGKTAFAAWLTRERGYQSHFSRYPDGRTVRGALRNLSAQLVTRFGLDDQAPGGMLPEWCQTPEGFESLLGEASARARAEAVPCVLVVDGLDEAELPDHGFPFGLPSFLPDAVYVIATYRTGMSPPRPEAPTLYLRIEENSPQNQDDIRAFLARIAGEGDIARRIAEARLEPADFVGLLAERSGGIWVYLRYVLAELRTGLRRADELDDLPAGLQQYYAEQVRRWQRDPEWDAGLLPLVATLGAVAEPMPAAALARLAGDLSPAAVRRWCDLTVRPLLATTAGAPMRYTIYHETFREVLHGVLPAMRQGVHPYHAVALADELHSASIAAHSRVAGAYLSYFGGLDAALPALADDPGIAAAEGGYPLRHLARHLQYAERAADLRRLLSAERPADGHRAVNVWFAAHDQADRAVGYLEDVKRARHLSARDTDRALGDRRPAASLGQEIRYLLIASSIASSSSDVPVVLLAHVVRVGLWSPERGLDHARRLPSAGLRLTVFAALRPYLRPDQQNEVSAEALATAAGLFDHRDRAQSLAALIPLFQGDQQTALAIQALEAAAAISDDDDRAETMAALAPCFPADQKTALVAEVLAAASAIFYGPSRARALASLAPSLTIDQLDAALTAATSTYAKGGRAEALGGLAPYLPAGLLDRAVAAADDLGDGTERVEALTGLLPYVPADRRAALADRALEVARRYLRTAHGTALVAGVIPFLAAARQPAVLAEALATARFMSGWELAQALASLLPCVPADQRAALVAEALDAAITADFEPGTATALTGLARYLTAEQVAKALTAAKKMTRDWDRPRERALAGLAPYLTSRQLAEALDAAMVSGYDMDQRAQALGSLAAQLQPGDLAADLAADAFAVAVAAVSESSRARAPSGWWSRADTLIALAPHLAPDLLPRVLDTATALRQDSAQARALTGLAPHLPWSLLARALTAAAAITDDADRATALIGLAPYLAANELAQALDTAAAISHDWSRAKALTGLAPHLPGSLLDRALTAAAAISGDAARATALGGLVPYAPSGRRRKLLTRALDAAARESYENSRAEALIYLAPRLPSDLRADAVTVAFDISYSGARLDALVGMAPFLKTGQLQEVLAAVTAVGNVFPADALVSLAPYLPADLLGRALAAAAADSYLPDRVKALTGMAPYLPAELLDRAVDAALKMAPAYQVEALVGLLRHVPACRHQHLLARAKDAVGAMSHTDDRAIALASLVPFVPADEQQAMIARALDAAISNTYFSGRAKALTSLSQYLTADQLADAYAASPADRSAILTTAILARNRRTPPADQAAESVALLRDGLEGADRRCCLTAITNLAPMIAQLGGVPAMNECIRGILETHRWWP